MCVMSNACRYAANAPYNSRAKRATLNRCQHQRVSGNARGIWTFILAGLLTEFIKEDAADHFANLRCAKRRLRDIVWRGFSKRQP